MKRKGVSETFGWNPLNLEIPIIILFFRRFATRCSGCNIVLQKQDLVRRARNLVFHVDCFRCNICQKKLDTGEQVSFLSTKFTSSYRLAFCSKY